MKIWCLDKVSLKRIHVGWVVQLVKDQLWVLLMDALIVQKVLDFNQIHSHIYHFLEEYLLAFGKEVLLLLIATEGSLLG